MIKDVYKALVPLMARARLSRIAAAFRDEEVSEVHRQWLQEAGPLRLLQFDLTTEDFVVDIGAYRGQWVADMFTRYQCHLAAVEPVEEFAADIKAKYAINTRISLHRLGLGAQDRVETIQVQGDASSMHLTKGVSHQIQIRDVSGWLRKQPWPVVALMSINCEGGEYEIIPRLIETGEIARVKRLLVQFHQVDGSSGNARERIREALMQTHREIYCYPFLWEYWEAH
jgi:FkbM family methyltransferase